MNAMTSNPTGSRPDWLIKAIEQGLLPTDAQIAVDQSRPWPVVIMTVIGAWIAASFLLFAFGLLLGGWLFTAGGSAILVGTMLLVVAIAVLRQGKLPLFFEQLAVPMLCVGGALIGVGLASGYQVSLRWICAALVLVTAIAAILIHRSLEWLRTLLGATMCVLLMTTISLGGHGNEVFSPWMATHILAFVWIASMMFYRHDSRDSIGAWLTAIEPVLTGWGLAVLAMLVWLSGMTFLLGGVMSTNMGLSGATMFGYAIDGHLRAVVSAALTICAAVLPMRSVRQRAGNGERGATSGAAYGVVVVVCVLAWFVPNLGCTLLMMSMVIALHRYRMATAAAVVAVWVLGSFYYQLHWPLATKALVLVAVGAALAALAWVTQARHSQQLSTADSLSIATSSATYKEPLLLLLCAGLTLGVGNYAIYEKEILIRDGQRVFVSLAPRDPRSLMQGDYMALNFFLPSFPASTPLVGAERLYAIGKVNSQGVFEATRVEGTNASVNANEIRVQLTAKNGRWTFVTDAWFFAEGDAQRWEQARFGEFRVMPNGRALLVGMADEKLAMIGTQGRVTKP
jgi:uncharacterized membrane-anchored protein